MAGDYFDADAYDAERAKAFADAVLNANQGGVSPLPTVDAPPTVAGPSIGDQLAQMRQANAAREADQAKRFREAVLPVAKRAAPLAASTVPFIGGALGTATEQVIPRETIRETYGPNVPGGLAHILGNTGDLKPMPDMTPEIKAAPTLADQARKAVGGGLMMGGGAPSGTLAAWRMAQQDQVDTLGHGADLQLDLGNDKAAATTAMANLRAEQAAKMQRDAEDQQRVDAEAAARQEAFLAKSQQMADAVAANNVDPLRFIHNLDTKQQFMWGLAAALDGSRAAENGGVNHALERLDQLATKDFAGQLENANNQRAALSSRNTVFAQIASQNQDKRLAMLQGRDLMYAAMKTALMAKADALGVPEILTQAKIAANVIDNNRAALWTQMKAASYQAEQAAAAARVAAQRQAEERAYRMGQDAIHNNQEQQKIDIQAGKEGPNSKEAGERKVVIDGQDALAVNKTAAEKWNEYNHGRAVFATALQELKAAREKGDVGAYNAARANLIEEYPKLLGYTRAPTEGQIKATVGPEAIPEYNHWYNHVNPLTYGVAQNRAEEKLKILDKTLAVSDKAMRENTFGANAPTAAGALPPGFKPDTAAPEKK